MIKDKTQACVKLWKCSFTCVYNFNTFIPYPLLGLINFKLLTNIQQIPRCSSSFQLMSVSVLLSLFTSHTDMNTHTLALSLSHLASLLSPLHTLTLTSGLTGVDIHHITPFNQSMDRCVLSDKPLIVIYLSFTMPL